MKNSIMNELENKYIFYNCSIFHIFLQETPLLLLFLI